MFCQPVLLLYHFGIPIDNIYFLKMIFPRGVLPALKSLKPSTSTSVAMYSLVVGGSEIKTPLENSVKITTLLPGHEDHFDIFKRVITHPTIALTSSWIDKWFGITKLNIYCRNFESKLAMADAGDTDVLMPQETLDAFHTGAVPRQLALNKFFLLRENDIKLRMIYEGLVERAEESGLGYYKFSNTADELLGGGALAPLVKKSEPVKKVDIALHILEQKKGIGNLCMAVLLKRAFEECGVEEVWGSSVMDHPISPVICAKYGMIIESNAETGMKHYFIDKSMWDATKDKREKVRRDPIAASTHFAR
jgi:hypothetical protein